MDSKGRSWKSDDIKRKVLVYSNHEKYIGWKGIFTDQVDSKVLVDKIGWEKLHKLEAIIDSIDDKLNEIYELDLIENAPYYEENIESIDYVVDRVLEIDDANSRLKTIIRKTIQE